MSNEPDKTTSDGPPAEYEAAMAELEERAARGEMTIAEVKREIFALRERFAAGADVVTRWAVQAHAANPGVTEKPASDIDPQVARSPSGRRRKAVAQD